MAIVWSETLALDRGGLGVRLLRGLMRVLGRGGERGIRRAAASVLAAPWPTSEMSVLACAVTASLNDVFGVACATAAVTTALACGSVVARRSLVGSSVPAVVARRRRRSAAGVAALSPVADVSVLPAGGA